MAKLTKTLKGAEGGAGAVDVPVGRTDPTSAAHAVVTVTVENAADDESTIDGGPVVAPVAKAAEPAKPTEKVHSVFPIGVVKQRHNLQSLNAAAEKSREGKSDSSYYAAQRALAQAFNRRVR